MLSEKLVEAVLIRRYKRFLADVEIPGKPGKFTVHCPNPGSMTGLAEEGMRIWLREAQNPSAKLGYAWVLTELPSGLVIVDTLFANKFVFAAMQSGKLTEFCGYEIFKKEQKFRESRFDFLLSAERLPDCFVEVKSVTLADRGLVMFPDARTERGRKHLAHLIECARLGKRAVQYFCVCRSDCSSFSAADHIDPDYGRSLRLAAAEGVEIMARSVDVKREGADFRFDLSVGLPVRLN